MKTKISRILGVGVTLALLSSLLVGALPASALSSASVTIDVGESTISRANAGYTVTFNIATELVAGDTIVITFPSDTGVAAAVAGATISTSPGWITNPAPPPATTWGGGVGAGAFTTSTTGRTVTYTLAAGDNLGAQANISINLPAGITNPSIPGDYTLTVVTTKETTAVTSATYPITEVTDYDPGRIFMYNTSGYLVGTFTGAGNFQTAVNNTLAGFTLELETGYYDENVVVPRQLTIKAVDGQSPVIGDLPRDTVGVPSGSLTITSAASQIPTQAGVVLEGLTFSGDTEAAAVLLIDAEGVTVQNCTFEKAGSSATAAAQTMIMCTAAPLTYPNKITNCDFDMGLGAVSDIGVGVAPVGGSYSLPDAGDVLTITDAVGGDSGRLGVSVGTLVATAGGATYAAGVWTTPAAGASLTLTAATISQSGNWASTTGTAIGAITTDVDFDASVGTGPSYLTISGCTFAGDGAGAAGWYIQDYYIQNAGGTASKPTVSSGNTATGSFGGTHIRTLAGVAASVNDDISGLWRGLRLQGGSLTVSGATITRCGLPASSFPPIGVPAVDISAGSRLTMTNSSVTSSYGYGFNLQATATAGNQTVMFNEISNTNNVYSALPSPFPGENFTHNWWGDPDGPASTSIGYATSALVERIDTGFPLGAPATGDIRLNTAAYQSTTTGATIVINTTVPGYPLVPTGVASPAALVGAAQYESNPIAETPYPVLDGGHYDIFVGGPGAATDIATVSIPNANVSANTLVLVWNELIGDWGEADNQGVNAYSGTAWFTAGPGTWPEVGNMAGTPVALVDGPEPQLAAPAQDSLVPTVAAENVSVTLTSFTWGAVDGATGYNFQLSQYLAGGEDPFVSAFLILEESPDTNGVILVNVTLDYLETYAWRVQAVRGTDTGAWATSFFVTAAEPEEAPDLIEIVIPEPTPTPEIEVIVPAPTEVQVIPDYLLWVVVGVGAVLVIAVIVLIVRTRRVA